MRSTHRLRGLGQTCAFNDLACLQQYAPVTPTLTVSDLSKMATTAVQPGTPLAPSMLNTAIQSAALDVQAPTYANAGVDCTQFTNVLNGSCSFAEWAGISSALASMQKGLVIAGVGLLVVLLLSKR